MVHLSYGVIMWEVLHRKAPFEGMNRFQIIFQVGTQGKTLSLNKEHTGGLDLWPA
eukprot:COSAG05_NODE_19339_length_294_cov_0.794872_2_plen_54_part_01